MIKTSVYEHFHHQNQFMFLRAQDPWICKTLYLYSQVKCGTYILWSSGLLMQLLVTEKSEGLAPKKVFFFYLWTLGSRQQIGYVSVHCSSIMSEVLFWNLIIYVFQVIFQAKHCSIKHLIKYPMILKKCSDDKRANQQRKCGLIGAVSAAVNWGLKLKNSF